MKAFIHVEHAAVVYPGTRQKHKNARTADVNVVSEWVVMIRPGYGFVPLDVPQITPNTTGTPLLEEKQSRFIVCSVQTPTPCRGARLFAMFIICFERLFGVPADPFRTIGGSLERDLRARWLTE